MTWLAYALAPLLEDFQASHGNLSSALAASSQPSLSKLTTRTPVYFWFIFTGMQVSLYQLNSTKMTLDIFMPANCKLLLLLDI